MNLLEFVQSQGAELSPQISEEQIILYELRTGLKLPKGLRDFYLQAGGTGGFTYWDWRIWAFGELVTLNECVRGELDVQYLTDRTSSPVLTDYVAFCDVLIQAPIYAVCCRESNERYSEVIFLSGDSSQWLAGAIRTFQDFVTILSHQWEEILLPDTHGGQDGSSNSPGLRASP